MYGLCDIQQTVNMSSFQSFFYEKDEFFSNLDLLLKSNDAKEMQKIVERQIDVVRMLSIPLPCTSS